MQCPFFCCGYSCVREHYSVDNISHYATCCSYNTLPEYTYEKLCHCFGSVYFVRKCNPVVLSFDDDEGVSTPAFLYPIPEEQQMR